MSPVYTPLEAGTSILINLNSRELYLFAGGRHTQTFTVGVGKRETPTPIGHYKIVNKLINPGGVLGSRWMGLDIPNGPYGIHGTNNPASIGHYVSNGCIRMYNQDVELLFSLVNIGTPVLISKSPQEQMPWTQPGTGDNYPWQPPAEHQLTPVPPPQHSPKPKDKKYTVMEGDTLWKIAYKTGTTLDHLVVANNLSNPNLIYPGQIIIIPFQ